MVFPHLRDEMKTGKQATEDSQSSPPNGSPTVWLRPLTAMLVVVGAFLLLYGLFNRELASEDPSRFDVVASLPAVPNGTDGTTAALVNGHPVSSTDASRDGRPALGLAAAIDNELLFQAAIAMDLHRDDEIIRRRAVQLMREVAIAEYADGNGDGEPSADELHAFYEAHRQRFASRPRVKLRQVFVPHGDGAEARARRVAQDLQTGGSWTAALATEPNRPPFDADGWLDLGRLGEYYGAAFAERATTESIGVVTEPIASSFGFHVAAVEARALAEPIPFSRALPSVRAAVGRERQRLALAALLDRLRERADIQVPAGTRAALLAEAKP